MKRRAESWEQEIVIIDSCIILAVFCAKAPFLYVLVGLLQVLLMLTTDLEPEEQKDWAALESFLTTIIKELDLTGEVSMPLPDIHTVKHRDSRNTCFVYNHYDIHKFSLDYCFTIEKSTKI